MEPDKAKSKRTPLPSATDLSMLAAQPRFSGYSKDSDALRAALSMWRTAQWFLDQQQEYEDWRVQELDLLQAIDEPQKWPATFADFLRLVVKGKDQGEQLSRYRRFLLREQHDYQAKFSRNDEKPLSPKAEIDMVDKKLTELRKNPLSKNDWDLKTYQFQKFWTAEVKTAKRRAGKESAKLRAGSKS